MSIKRKLHIDVDLHCDGLTVLSRWLEVPLADGLNRLFVQIRMKFLYDCYIANLPFRCDDNSESDNTLNAGPAGLFGVVRRDRIRGLRRSDSFFSGLINNFLLDRKSVV